METYQDTIEWLVVVARSESKFATWIASGGSKTIKQIIKNKSLEVCPKSWILPFGKINIHLKQTQISVGRQ